MTDRDLEHLIATELAKDFVARKWPSLREDLVDINIDMVRSAGWGDFHPLKIAATAVKVMRSNPE